MITIITGADVFAPEYSGINDLVIIGGRTALIERETDIEKYLALDIPVNIISGEGKMLTPGIIDPHVHLIGGGGEGGYHTRTPETHIGQFIEDRKSTRLNSSHVAISYAVFCLKKKKKRNMMTHEHVKD